MAQVVIAWALLLKGGIAMQNKLSLKAKRSWFISRAIFLIIIIAVAIVIRFVLLDWIQNKFIMDLILGVIILFQLANTFLYPGFEYRQWSYDIDQDKVEFCHGIYITKRTLIPTVRIQHLNISQGPINRPLGLANINITTAGGSFTIPCLDKEEAEKLSDYLKEIIQLNIKNNTIQLGDGHEK